ncbi:MAG: hypothetical protein FWE79_01670, partial [Firmicutes bacterium]|nr:hypothetical protein [Bacillota bacterium]
MKKKWSSFIVAVFAFFFVFLAACQEPTQNIRISVSQASFSIEMSQVAAENRRTVNATVSGLPSGYSAELISIQSTSTGVVQILMNEVTRSGGTTTIPFVAVGAGTAQIIVISEGNRRATVDVEVSIPVSGMAFSSNFFDTNVLVRGAAYTLPSNALNILPSNATDTRVAFFLYRRIQTGEDFAFQRIMQLENNRSLSAAVTSDLPAGTYFITAVHEAINPATEQPFMARQEIRIINRLETNHIWLSDPGIPNIIASRLEAINLVRTGRAEKAEQQVTIRVDGLIGAGQVSVRHVPMPGEVLFTVNRVEANRFNIRHSDVNGETRIHFDVAPTEFSAFPEAWVRVSFPVSIVEEPTSISFNGRTGAGFSFIAYENIPQDFRVSVNPVTTRYTQMFIGIPQNQVANYRFTQRDPQTGVSSQLTFTARTGEGFSTNRYAEFTSGLELTVEALSNNTNSTTVTVHSGRDSDVRASISLSTGIFLTGLTLTDTTGTPIQTWARDTDLSDMEPIFMRRGAEFVFNITPVPIGANFASLNFAVEGNSSTVDIRHNPSRTQFVITGLEESPAAGTKIVANNGAFTMDIALSFFVFDPVVNPSSNIRLITETPQQNARIADMRTSTIGTTYMALRNRAGLATLPWIEAAAFSGTTRGGTITGVTYRILSDDNLTNIGFHPSARGPHTFDIHLPDGASTGDVFVEFEISFRNQFGDISTISRFLDITVVDEISESRVFFYNFLDAVESDGLTINRMTSATLVDYQDAGVHAVEQSITHIGLNLGAGITDRGVPIMPSQVTRIEFTTNVPAGLDILTIQPSLIAGQSLVFSILAGKLPVGAPSFSVVVLASITEFEGANAVTHTFRFTVHVSRAAVVEQIMLQGAHNRNGVNSFNLQGIGASHVFGVVTRPNLGIAGLGFEVDNEDGLTISRVNNNSFRITANEIGIYRVLIFPQNRYILDRAVFALNTFDFQQSHIRTSHNTRGIVELRIVVSDGDVIAHEIANEIELRNTVGNANYRLVNNIALSTSWNTSNFMIGGGVFNGTLFGDGFTISGLRVTADNEGEFAFIRQLGVDGKVIDLNIVGATLTANAFRGDVVFGIVVAENLGRVENVRASGRLDINNGYRGILIAGGVVGI